MAKDRSFSSKVAKGAHETAKCPKCGEIPNVVLVVASVKDESKNSWKFKDKIVQVCKCNENEVYG